MSLRRSLVIGFSVLLTLVGALASVYAYGSARHEVWGILDLQQRQIARFIGDGSGVAPNGLVLPPHEDDEDFVVQLLFADGRAPRVSNPDISFPSVTVPGFSEFTDPSGDWRLFTLVDGPRTIRVAQRTSERDELAADAAWNSSVPFLFAIPLSWLVVYGLVGAIMKRLGAITNEVASRTRGDVALVDTAQAPQEVRPLLAAMNQAFASLSGVLQQQRLFVADAAHELRTPLAALSLQIGNLESANHDPAMVEQINALSMGVRRASRVTSQLLQLARHEAAFASEEFTNVALDLTAVKAIGTVFPLAEVKSVDLGLAASVPLVIRAQEQDLLTLCEILIDNAVRYTPLGGQVDVSVTRDGRFAVLTVADTGPGIPAPLLDRVFDRFFRVNESDGLGTGLGLSIARVIAERQQAALTLENRSDRNGLIARVSFAGLDTSAI